VGHCPLTVTMDFVEAMPQRALPSLVEQAKDHRKPVPQRTLQIWDNLPARPGPRSDRPWGATHEQWDAARKRFERRVYVHQARAPKEVRRRMIGHLRQVVRDQLRDQRRRVWVDPVAETPEVAQLTRVEAVFQPADATSPTMVRMILEGRMPGFEWDPSRGVIRVRTEIRVRPIGGRA
jgi:hypothetical protein